MRTSISRRGGVLFGLSLAGFLLLCVFAAAGLYAVRHVTVHNGVSIDTPAGRIDIHPHDKFDASITGVPAYPGAKSRNGGAVVEWSSSDGSEDKGLAVAETVTPDPVDKVVEYYRSRLPDWNVERERGGGIKMEMDEGGTKRVIGIERKSDGTHIGVATVGEPASN
jgi:hypothetical protein